jgi:hypothetical protein
MTLDVSQMTVGRPVDMTPMSECRRLCEALPEANPRELHAVSWVARRVHSSALAMFAVLTAACVVPPPLSVEGEADAGANAPPIIIEAHDGAANPLEPPDSVTVDRDALNPTLGVTVYDVDGADTLFVGMFVDFDPASPLGPRADCMAPPAADGAASRSTVCSTSALCTAEDLLDNPHRLEIVVYDREPRAAPEFRLAGPPEDPGLTSIWTFQMFCTESNPT